MDDSYTIQISSNLVNRLAHTGEKSKKRTKKSKPKVADGSQLSDSKTAQKQAESFDMHKAPAPSKGWPLQPPLFLPVTTPPPSVTYSEELQEIRSVVKESENVLEKLQKREADMAREVAQRAKELHEKEVKLQSQKHTPCLAEKNACLECYSKYPGNPLVCADVVKSFSNCARKAWQQMASSVEK